MASNDQMLKSFRDFLGRTIQEMRETMSSGGASPYKDMNASGKSRRAFRFTIKTSETELIGIIYGPAHVEYLERGRGPGKAPPRDTIKAWIRDKGIVPRDITEDSLAYLIQRKIAQQGTRMHARNHRSGILSKTTNRRRIKAFYDTITDAARLDIRYELGQRLHEINPDR